MTNLRTAAQQALEALQDFKRRGHWGDFDNLTGALKAALVEDAMQKFTDVNQELEAALAEPVQGPDPWGAGYEAGYAAGVAEHRAEPVHGPLILFLADELEIPLGTVIQSEVCRRAAKELRRLHAELERCKQVCAATSEAWREEAALAEPCPCGDRPAAQCPGEWEPGCDLGNNPKYAKRVEMTPKELAASIKRGEKWKVAEPVLNPAPGYCKHCKQYTIEEPLPAEPVQEPYDQTSLELCNVCGWKTLIPGDCCLNCVRKHPLGQASTDVPLTVYSVKKAHEP